MIPLDTFSKPNLEFLRNKLITKTWQFYSFIKQKKNLARKVSSYTFMYIELEIIIRAGQVYSVGKLFPSQYFDKIRGEENPRMNKIILC